MKSYRQLFLYTLLVIGLTLIACGIFFRGCAKPRTDKIEIHDTIYTDKKDSAPEAKKKEVIKYVTLPSSADSINTGNDVAASDSLCDGSVTLPVVQKEYTDDSTYTAYVSGVEYNDLPKLDSIIVRQREVQNTIREITTVRDDKKRHWSIGLQGGYGVGLKSKSLEPYIGIGITYCP